MRVRELREAAESGDHLDAGALAVLWCDRFSAAYMLLAGCGLESAMKGLLIAMGKVPIEGPKLPKSILTHDLVCLARRCGVALSAAEERELERLSKVIRWRGRYPIPTFAGRLKPEPDASGKGLPMLGWEFGYTWAHPECYKGVLTKLLALYPRNGSTDIAGMLRVVERECPPSPG